MKFFGSIFSLTSFILAIYVLVMKEYRWIELVMLMFSLSIGIMGIEEIKKDHKGRGVLLISVGLLCLYSSIQGFLFLH
ncbi:DUF3953 domain-containing protein [Rossellomorea aquimaris]|uniref:DUF3953 domain-containing protein n=1 Tax=Rossellomorea TaxID=2837508 RepID=UPI001CD6DA46|nr:DUF3953 domain-containing protein [Rossellomorea aquimaris]MCA1060490.1 DUF3953 domain-containing protein [Rossellomorea aquimaris]